MSKQVKINVFVKERENKTTHNKFNTYCTKDKSGNYYEVKFTSDCENKNLIPTGKKPFVVVTENNRISTSSKFVDTVTELGEVVQTIKRTLYIKSIIDVEEYIEPDCDTEF